MAGNSTLDATRERVESADDAAWTSVPATDEAILRMRQSVIHGQHWFEALLEPVLTVNHGLAHTEDGFIGRGYARPGRIICGFDALPRCIEGRITSHGHATS